MEGLTSWSNQGYFYAHPRDRDVHDAGACRAENPWIVFGDVLELAKRGSFDALDRLREWLGRNTYEGLSEACVDLLGDAGRPSDLMFLKHLLEEGALHLSVSAAQSARMAGYLWLLPSMLKAWKRSVSPHSRSMIALEISEMIEVPGGPIAEISDDPRTCDSLRCDPSPSASVSGEPSAFELAVLESQASLQARFGPRLSLWRGEPFDVSNLIHEMQKLVKLGNPVGYARFPLFRRKLEATTGWACTGFYKQGMLDPQGVVEVLREMSRHVDLASFLPGSRHFFKHRLSE